MLDVLQHIVAIAEIHYVAVVGNDQVNGESAHFWFFQHADLLANAMGGAGQPLPLGEIIALASLQCQVSTIDQAARQEWTSPGAGTLDGSLGLVIG